MKLEIKDTTAEDWVGAPERISDDRMNIPRVPNVSVSTIGRVSEYTECVTDYIKICECGLAV
jgi:hypothetical protein